MRLLLVLFSFVCLHTLAFSQITNANCSTAIVISNPIDYCSGFGEFSNVGAGPGNPIVGSPSCFNNSDNDVWFRFTSFAKAVNILVSGNSGGQMTGGTLIQPEVALYEDNGCTIFSEIQCGSDIGNTGAISINKGGLTIGQSYIIRVDGRGSSQGTFTLCIRNFNPPVMPGQDCITGSVLCDKSSFIVEDISGGGNDDQELRGIPCEFDEAGNSSNLTESDATWFRWTCETSGTLTFVLDPLIPGDDIDWALFELPNGVDNCSGKIHLRCAFNSPTNQNGTGTCGDLTGMNSSSADTAEDFNCESNEDGFVDQINMVAGTSYALGINNFSPSNIGFEIEFGGSGTFQGPEPDFDIDPLEGLKCDTFFTITDLTTFDPSIGNIVSWDWNFGERADPPTATGPGPFQVTYISFGQKFITLTVETDKGCIVTKILELYAEPCCEDLPDIDIQVVDFANLVCADRPDGFIEVAGTNGNPEYQYSIDGNLFNPNPFFGNLDAGTYQLYVQDIKGCTDSIEVIITAPPPIVVDAGADITVDLCFEAQLFGSYSPIGPNDMVTWSTVDPADSLSIFCFGEAGNVNCLDPIVIAPGQTTYILTVENEDGCTASDEVTVFVNEDYPIYGPNIFTPNGDGLHDMYTIYGGPAAINIQEFYIYDRWGSLIFFAEDIVPNDPNLGWDGRFKNKELGTQVFTWYAVIEFCDSDGPDDYRGYNGHITLLRE